MKTIALFGTLGLGASLGNMNIHLWGVVELLPLLLINAAGVAAILYVWADD